MADIEIKEMMIRVRIISLFIASLFTALAAPISWAEDNQVRIAVLAKRGAERCLEKWSPTAEYLTARIPGRTFAIVPVDFDQIYSSVEKKEVDFVLVNPSFYVELESLYGVSRIATLKNQRLDGVFSEFGGLVFCKADRKDILRFNDLRGKSFMSVDERALGAWRAVWRELKVWGVDPYRDFTELRFGGTHDAVVYAVRDGNVDAGSVRTDTLERMALEGKVDVKTFRVISQHRCRHINFPFLHSTPLYPEWPFAKLKHTSDELAEKVAIALLEMPHSSPAARAARCAGWTIPLNYQSVHECLKELKLGAYKDLGKITLSDVIRNYWHWILVVSGLFLVVAVFTAIILKLNRDIKASQGKLQSEVDERKRAEEAQRESEEHFRKVIENIFKFVPEGLLVFTNKLNLFRKNKAFEEIVQKYSARLNYPEEELAEIIIQQIKSRAINKDHTEIRISKKQQ